MCLVGFRGGTRGLVLCRWFMLIWTADDGVFWEVDSMEVRVQFQSTKLWIEKRDRLPVCVF